MKAVHQVLPGLDCHAHIAPDATRKQLDTLGDARIFAVTRSLAEARKVVHRVDSNLTWGIGTHPGVSAARTSYDPEEFRRLLPHFAFVGEVGLDRRGGLEQGQIFADVLEACRDQPVLISIHSTGRAGEAMDLLARRPHPGAILHWFLGTTEETARAVALGMYFSVNAAMRDDLIAALPPERVLPETDFPAKGIAAELPGAISGLEQRLGGLWGITPEQVRSRLWLNLKTVAINSGAIESVSDALADTLLTV